MPRNLIEGDRVVTDPHLQKAWEDYLTKIKGNQEDSDFRTTSSFVFNLVEQISQGKVTTLQDIQSRMRAYITRSLRKIKQEEKERGKDWAQRAYTRGLNVLNTIADQVNEAVEIQLRAIQDRDSSTYHQKIAELRSLIRDMCQVTYLDSQEKSHFRKLPTDKEKEVYLASKKLLGMRVKGSSELGNPDYLVIPSERMAQVVIGLLAA